MDVTEQAINMVLERNDVSMAELSRIEGFSGGNLCYIASQKNNLNVILWDGITQAGSDAIDALQEDPRFEAQPCDPLVYLIDGASLNLPILTDKMISARRKHEKDVWLPVMFKRVSNSNHSQPKGQI